MNGYRPKTCLSICSTEQACEGMMRDIGKESHTFGHIKHWLSGASLDYVPLKYVGPKMAQGFMI